jgi:tol-pal system protein YbgF
MIGSVTNMRWQLTAVTAAFALTSVAHAGGYQGPHDLSRQQQWHGVKVAALFGESDEEKAARFQHESDQDAQINDLERRVHDLEQSLQQQTGQNEQLAHRLQEMGNRIDRQQKDFNYKLCTLTAQQLGAPTSADQLGNGLPCDTSAAAPVAGLATNQVQGSGGTLGNLPQGTTSTPSLRPQFDEAMNMLAKAQYDEARAAFRAFVDANPKDDLAPQALYWVGDIAFVQKDYAGAVQAFKEGILKYPSSPRGPDSMLKLGQSFLALGQKKEGCLTLGAIKSKYPHAPASLISQAATARSVACK